MDETTKPPAQSPKRAPTQETSSKARAKDGDGGHHTEAESLRRELSEARHDIYTLQQRAQKGEIASGVLHNVGNVLTSILVSTSKAAEGVAQLRIDSLAKLTALVEEHRDHLGDFVTNDPRGQRLPDFLARLNTHLQEERTQILAELDMAKRHLDHVRSVINSQQGRGMDTRTEVDVRSVVDTALNIGMVRLEQLDITVRREYEDVPRLFLDRNSLLQILVNLISNARHALTDFGDISQRESQEKLLVAKVHQSGEQTVVIEIYDNGVGIAPELLDKIFLSGVTTKPDGHGLGLATSIALAKELRGELRAFSDGKGKGATFTLELPIDPMTKSG